MESLKEKLNSLPTTSGVYLMKDKGNNIIYIGKAKNLKRRVNQYFDSREKNLKTQLLVSNICDFDYILTSSEYDALMLENNLIKKHQPHYNILLKDGKNFAYLKIDLNNPFPRVEITRKVDFKKNVKYFGPYLNGISAYSILDIIRYAYPLRTCNLNFKKHNDRECLKYHLGECSAPCTNKITKEDYGKIVEEVIDFLNGNTSVVKDILLKKMSQSAENENFERAIIYKNQLEMLEKINNNYTTQFAKKLNIDIVGCYYFNQSACICILIIRNGKMIGRECYNVINKLFDESSIISFFVQYYTNNKLLPSELVVPNSFEGLEILEEFFEKNFNKKVKISKVFKGVKNTLQNLANQNAKEYLEKSLNVEELKLERTIGAIKNLKDKLNLRSVPYRIEGFDISNISGTNKVASMVVFVDGEPKKEHYRKFKIKSFEGPDDFASMEEVIKRRMLEYSNKSNDESFSTKPNLILIDGGKGQLSSASKVLRKFDSEIEIISLAKKNEEIYKENESNPIMLKRNEYSLQLLQRVRDESHRFAITFHRSLRNKSALKSKLLEIDGIGETKAKRLFGKFRTIENIKKASIDDLTRVSGINKRLAKEILKTFN